MWSYSRTATGDRDKRSERPFKILREEIGFPKDPSNSQSPPVSQPYTRVDAQNKLLHKSTDRAAAAGSKLRLFCGDGGRERTMAPGRST